MAFTLRLSDSLHEQALAFAVDRGMSLQSLVSIALSEYLRVRRLEGVDVKKARPRSARKVVGSRPVKAVRKRGR